MSASTSQEARIPTQIKLSALWAALMSCYIYCDHLGLYVKGSIMKMNDGLMGPLGVATPQILIGVSTLMAIPALMIALCVNLPPKFVKILNMVVAVIYIIVQALTIPGSEAFYIFYSFIEILILASIFVISLKWPIQKSV